MVAFLDYLPRGHSLSDPEFTVRHTFLQWVLLVHLPVLLVFGLLRGFSAGATIEALAAPAAFLALSRVLHSRRLRGLAVTAGLSTCSVALVALSGGSIEAHFHFFATIGFIALYQDWVPFVWNAVFTTFSHGIGSWLVPTAFFSHTAGQNDPWTWAVVHGLAVLAACVGVMLLLRFTEDDHQRTVTLRAQLVEGNRKRFTADLLVNLARRNQNLIYRQLELLNRLEDHERDAEQLSHLFQLDHLATRIRRNAESLLVLSGEEPARKWGGSVLLVDVVRAAIAEIEELDRVDFSVDESLAVSGRAVADATHLLAELIENAVHFSPPGLSVMIRTRPYLPSPGAHVLTIEDWGVGMSPSDLADANDLLRRPRDVDLATSQRLGLHVVARLAARYQILCSVESTPGGGVTAVVILPAELFAEVEDARTPVAAGATAGRGRSAGRPGHDGPGLNGPGPTGAELTSTGSSRATGPGPSPNGSGPNGSGPNGSGPNGSGPNGSGPNGSGSYGSGSNGLGLNGSGHDGSAYDGHGYGGSNGSGVNGAGHNGAGLNGAGDNGAGHDTAGLNGTGLNGTGPYGTGSTGLGPNGTGSSGTGLNGTGLNGTGPSGAGLNGTGPSRAGLNGTGPSRAGLNGAGPGGAGSDGLDGTGRTGLEGLHDPRSTGRETGGPGLDGGLPGRGTTAAGVDGPESLSGMSGLAGFGGGATAAGLAGTTYDAPGRTGPDDLGERRVPGAALGRPEDAPLPAPRPEPARREDPWSSWWPLPADDSAAAPGSRDGGLARRTPQANLADELRRGKDAPAQPVRPRRDPAETRSALSRFQATQRAAREGVRRDPGTEGKGRP